MKFINKHISEIILAISIFVLLLLTQTCSIKKKLTKIEKSQKIITEKFDEIVTVDQIQLLITIEGLKAEKRMIQSTDRKLFDLNRQNIIDEELQKLEYLKFDKE